MFVKFGVVDGNKLNSSTELNIADALDDAVTTNGCGLSIGRRSWVRRVPPDGLPTATRPISGRGYARFGLGGATPLAGLLLPPQK
jgi:hypothetical protein